jgi:ectoine hydroxylase-related dioxygenase (phytanoyl-CoA dioxygenase family)
MLKNIKFKNSFTKQGYLLLQNILDKKEKKIIKEIIYENFKKNIELPSMEKFDLENLNFHKKLINFRKLRPKKFGEIYDKINLNSKFRSIFYSKKFIDYFAKCLNIKNNQIYISGIMMRFDAPHDLRNKLNWHQDSPYYMMGYPKFNAGVCWCAVTKNTINNGTLKFIPKSHLKFIKKKGHKKNKISSEQFNIDIKKNEALLIKDLKQNFGDVSFFHMNLKHKSGDNNSKKVRITIGCRFIDMSKSFNTGEEKYRYNDKKFN